MAFTQYCVDTTNSCTPNIGGTSVSVTCGVGSVCQKYVRYRSFDNVNNAESVKSALVRIDKQAPSGGSISYPNGNTSSPISVSFSEGSDGGGSGIGTRLLQRSQGTLQGNKCKNYGAFATIATDPTSPYSDSVSGPACYKYQYDVADQVGNHAVYTSSSEAKIH
ncbi:MAG: hypothetical protein HY551_04650 [Elusimicrobia bacterium]|nr:hypothetical protein [Elusimicrobiota bacterium]